MSGNLHSIFSSNIGGLLRSSRQILLSKSCGTPSRYPQIIEFKVNVVRVHVQYFVVGDAIVIEDVNLSFVLLSVGVVKIIPCENSRTFVNGKLVTESTVLRSGECWNEDTLDCS